MNSIQILKNEHRLIEKVIGILEGMVCSSRKGEELSMERLKKILQFTRIFIDRCHHGKEESCLFPCLEKRGIPREGGPIGVMLQEHEMGRRLVQQIGQVIALGASTLGLPSTVDVFSWIKEVLEKRK